MAFPPLTVIPLPLGHVSLPPAHPRSTAGSCPIVAHVIDHPDGLILVDTGPRRGHPLIDELYKPQVITIVEALSRAGFDERDVAAIVNSHLHFDHCGNNYLLAHAPVWVAPAEHEAAAAPGYTVPEWASIDDARLRLSADGETIAPGVSILHTPGHTPGHQSVVIDHGGHVEVIGAQVCWTCAEFADRAVHEVDLHDASYEAAAAESLARVWALRPARVHLSHDLQVWQR